MGSVEVVRAHYAASDRGDLDGMLAPLADDVEWTEAAGTAYAGTYMGPDAVRTHVFGPIAAEWDGFGFDLAELLEAGSTVVALGSYRGTHRRTGKAVLARVAHVWRVADGKVRSFEQIADSALLDAAAT